MDQVPLLERGEVHIGIRHDQGVNPWFESFALPPDDVLAACRSSLPLGRGGDDRYRCAGSPPAAAARPRLLGSPAVQCSLPCGGCRARYSGREPSTNTLLALAEAGQGVAIIPSVLRTDRYRLTIARVAHRGKPLRDRYVIQWDKRRPMPSYAENFCAALAAYRREVLPITRPSEPPTTASERSGRAPARWSHRLSAPGCDVVMLGPDEMISALSDATE